MLSHDLVASWSVVDNDDCIGKAVLVCIKRRKTLITFYWPSHTCFSRVLQYADIPGSCVQRKLFAIKVLWMQFSMLFQH